MSGPSGFPLGRHPLVGLGGGWGREKMKKENKNMASTTKKRGRLEVDSDSEGEALEAAQRAVPDAWSRFIVVEGADPSRPLSKLSPFAVNKFFEGVSSQITDIKLLRNGSFLVKCTSQKASKLLLARNGSNCVDRPVKISPHKSLNSCKGVIRCRELEGMSEAEIRSGMEDQGVIAVHRVTVRKGSDRVPTNTLFLTFCLPRLPESVRVGYLRVPVKQFVPSPMRCFKCHRYGHGAQQCKGDKQLCVRCGLEQHEGDGCPLKCVNCGQAHASSAKDCPVYQTEAKIQEVRTVHRVSFLEAKKMVQISNPHQAQKSSYASVVKKTTAIETQTDLTWVTGDVPVRRNVSLTVSGVSDTIPTAPMGQAPSAGGGPRSVSL